jgi:hypothetical protein
MADEAPEVRYPSLGVVSEEIERVLTEQRKRADGLDTKGGITLAFAGALVAVTHEDPRLLVICGRIVAYDFLLMFKGRYYDAFRLLIARRRLGLRLALAVLAISVTLLTLGVTLSKTAGGAS